MSFTFIRKRTDTDDTEEETDKGNSDEPSEKTLSIALKNFMENILENKPGSKNIYNNLEHYLYRIIHALQKFEEPLSKIIYFVLCFCRFIWF